MDNLFDFLDLGNLNDLFGDLFNWDDLGNFNNSINDLLDDLFDLNDLGNNSEDLQDIVNVDNTHNFLVDHTNDSFVDLQNSSGSSFKLLKLLQQSFDQNSEMEFNLSGFFARIGVHILDSVDVRNILDDFNNSIKLIYFHDVDQFLLEEFIESGITFFSQFGILFEVLFHLDCQHVNQVLGPGFLNGNLNDLFSVVGQVNDSVYDRSLQISVGSRSGSQKR